MLAWFLAKGKGAKLAKIWGLDIGTTSIGWAVIEYDMATAIGRILGMGVRIFPEARDPDGTPLNQNRRQKRMARRQLRRRRERRKALNQMLADAGLLPPFGKDKSSEWTRIMSAPPLPIRARGLNERIELHELGRALYHLAKRRHFAGRDLEMSDAPEAENADEKAANDARTDMIAKLAAEGKTLGQKLAEIPSHKRSRGAHALRTHVVEEFEKLWTAQARYHPSLSDTLKAHVADIIFMQKPVFWRKSTLGRCRLMPGEELAPRGSWLSQQRRMLEKLNNLEIASGNRRPLDTDERAAVLEKLQTQASMTWGGVRGALKPLYAARGEKGMEQRIRFNLELGGDAKLLGNPLEAKLASIFADTWSTHPHRQAIRDAIHRRLWSADYGEVGTQRVVILSAKERDLRRAAAARSLIDDFGITQAQADALASLRLPAGWEAFSTRALETVLPELERGERFGTLMMSPERAAWREAAFPDREAPTGEVLDRLPSPARKRLPNGQWDTTEEDRIKAIRNPTVARTQNELRKVVNNLIDAFGKPDLIRIELAREVGLSKRECEERQAGMRKNNKRRADARKDFLAHDRPEPSERDITTWVLWKEGQERCPYTGDYIGFDALFGRGEFQVEHIWPRSRSLDDSQGNKTLCRKDINIEKGNRTPFEYFQSRPSEWDAVRRRLDGMTAGKGSLGFPRGKVRRFLAETMPDDFANRQLVDTGYAAKQAVTLLKRLWADVGEPNQAVDFSIGEDLRRRKVLPVTGKVTAQLRKLWGLNNILSEDGEKTRADHRHHAIDALVVACAEPGITQRLSNYWRQKDDAPGNRPHLPPPWPGIRAEAEQVVATIVVSHRVRKKVSGELHDQMPVGRTNEAEVVKNGVAYGQFVKRVKVEKLTAETLKLSDISAASRSQKFLVRDEAVRKALLNHIENSGKPPEKAYPPYPKLSEHGPEIRFARTLTLIQNSLGIEVANGFAETTANHHVAIWREGNGRISSEIVSLFEASRRLVRREPIICRQREMSSFIMSLAPGDTLRIEAGDRSGYWTVQGIWSSGQIVIHRGTDAVGASVFRPTASSLLALGARKVSVDPIGRVRPAND